ncbi:MAG: ABC transporter ATP-binding protein [Anaerolineales bacterium]|nr:ABC transporter ATP-binding protein [Anaerolineales bacterium]
MSSWFADLKRAAGRGLPQDRLAEGRPRASLRANLRLLQPYLAAHWRAGALGFSLILFTSLLAIPQPLVYRYLIDDALLGRRLDLLVWAAAALAALKGLSLAGSAAQQYALARFAQDTLLDIQRDLFEHTLRLPKSFFDDKETGYLMERLAADVSGLGWFFSGALAHLLSNLLRFIGGVGLLFYLNWRLASVTIIVLPLMLVAVRYLSERSRVLSHHRMERQALVKQRLQESLSASALIKAFGSQARESGRMASELDAARQIAMEQTVLGSAASLAIGALPALANGVALVAGAYWIIQGGWTLGSLLAFQSYLGYVYGPAMVLANLNMQFQSALAALERVSALYAIVPEQNLGDGLQAERLRGEVTFEAVSFAYDEREPVLQDVSCRIRAGERVAIVGPSGVGKTTLVSLLLRFYRPTRGEIYFDGLPASAYELNSLRRRIGYVSQNTLLLAGTILDNLRYGDPEASLEAVEQAARAAGIHDFIASLPLGYDSLVGERGVNLSEGQKQRLSLARALVRDADILVLDEPASALDSATERAVFDALPSQARGKTLFIVTHRMRSARDADRILLLNDRRLVAIGTHQELLQRDEYYRSLVLSAGEPPPD